LISISSPRKTARNSNPCRYELYAAAPADDDGEAELVLFSRMNVSFLYSQFVFYVRRTPALLPVMLWGDYPFPCIDRLGRPVAMVYPYVGWKLVRCFTLGLQNTVPQNPRVHHVVSMLPGGNVVKHDPTLFSDVTLV
jgi:hypothetical protein